MIQKEDDKKVSTQSLYFAQNLSKTVKAEFIKQILKVFIHLYTLMCTMEFISFQTQTE